MDLGKVEIELSGELIWSQAGKGVVRRQVGDPQRGTGDKRATVANLWIAHHRFDGQYLRRHIFSLEHPNLSHPKNTMSAIHKGAADLPSRGLLEVDDPHGRPAVLAQRLFEGSGDVFVQEQRKAASHAAAQRLACAWSRSACLLSSASSASAASISS